MVECPRCRCQRYTDYGGCQEENLLIQTCQCDSCGTAFRVEFELALLKVERICDNELY